MIRGDALSSGRVVVMDGRGDWIGIGVARILAERGHAVTLCVNGYAAGEALQQYVRDASLLALQRQRIEVMPLVRLFGVDDDSVYLQHLLSEELIIVEKVSGMVLASGHQSSSELLDLLTVSRSNVVGVGDCMSPRTVEEAVLEGLVVGSSL